MAFHVEIQRIAQAALAVAENLLADWLPDGKRRGKEYWPINPVRGDRKPGSFSINMMTGTWHDFACGDKGGDLVSLLAYLRGCRQMDAARLIAQQLGIAFNADPHKRDLLQDEIERQRIARLRQHRQQQDEIEQQVKWEQSAARAQLLWGKAKVADPIFPYLVCKGLESHHLRQLGRLLLIPIYWRGELVSLQFITADGEKRNQKDARMAGCYCPFGHIEAGRELLIVEGVATAATLHEETGLPVAAAMSSGNLLPAGLELQRRYPEAVLIVGGDDDRSKAAEGKVNTGKAAAIHAAAILGCGVTFPSWPANAPLYLSDYNDLRQWLEGRK
jgi:putative DNA primase/helicase